MINDPDWKTAVRAIGEKNFVVALNRIRKVLAHHPNDAEVHVQCGKAQAALHFNDEALACWKHAAEIDPANASAWFHIAKAHYNRAEYEAAVDAYRMTLELKPADASVWFDLGVAARDADLFLEAIRAFREAVRIRPEYGLAWHELYVACRQEGDETGAEEALQKAREYGCGEPSAATG